MLEPDAERLFEPRETARRQVNGAGPLQAHQPPALQELGGERGPERARHVVAALRPVQARLSQGASLPVECAQVDAQLPERPLPGGGDVIPVRLTLEETARQQSVRERHRDPAGEVVVAGACEHQGLVSLSSRLHRRDRTEVLQGLDGVGDRGPGEAVVAVTPVTLHAEQLSLQQLGEVGARRLRRDAGDAG